MQLHFWPGLLLLGLSLTACACLPNNPAGEGMLSGDFPAWSHQEEELLQRINEERSRQGKEKLLMREDLCRLARRYSLDMSQRHFFAHRDPDARNLAERLLAAGIDYWTAAENLAFISSTRASFSAHAVVEAWLNSPDHRLPLLDQHRHGYRYSGVGIVQDIRGNWYITHILLCPPKPIEKRKAGRTDHHPR